MSNEKNLKYTNSGGIFHASPNWPDTRTLSRYNELCGLDIKKELSFGGVWIDIGAGSCAKAMAELPDYEDVELIAVSIHKMNVPKRIKEIYACIPNNLILAEQYFNKAHLITDIYGAASYSDNPVHVMIYESMLLFHNKKLYVFTEFNKFGATQCWERIQLFFYDYLGYKVDFQEVITFADANKCREKCLRIVVNSNFHKCEYDMEYLLKKSIELIGIPIKENILWQSNDNRATIPTTPLIKITI